MAVDLRSQTVALSRSTSRPQFSPQRKGRSWWTVAITIALGFYTLVCFRYAAKCATGSDASGYLNSAVLLQRSETSFPQRKISGLTIGQDGVTSLLFMPIGLKAIEGDRLVPGYPVGLPLFLAILGKLLTWNDALRFNAVGHGVVGVIVAYLLARDFRLSSAWAFFVAVLIAGSPVYLFMSLQPMSDGPSLVWSGLTILLTRCGRRRPTFLLLGGVCFSISLLLRPTNALIALPVLVTLFPSLRQGLIFLAGAVPGTAVLLLYNHQTYGDPLGNGYIVTAQIFSKRFLLPSVAAYLRWLTILYTPFAAASAFLPWVRSLGGRDGLECSNLSPEPCLILSVRDKLTLMVWAGGFFSFYAAYFYTAQTWWYQRFLLPAMIPVVIAAACGLQHLIAQIYQSGRSTKSAPNHSVSVRGAKGFPSIRRTTMVATLCIGAALWYQIFWIRHLHALGPGRSSEPFLQAHRWVAAHSNEKPIVICMEASGSIFAYTSATVVRWDWTTPDVWRALQVASRKNHQPIYAVLDASEMTEARRRLAGPWVTKAAFGAVKIFSLN